MENGGPAFPVEHSRHSGHVGIGHEGMTLRDFIACHILQSMIKPSIPITQDDANAAYAAASLMIKARKNEQIG